MGSVAENPRTLVPIATDGGWGWMVLLGSFVAYFIADGWSYSFGVLFPELLTYFDEGKGKTAVIGALLYGVPCVISPVICALTNIYGCRIVTIVGGLFTALSFIVSRFATSVEFLCASTGLLASVGLGMTYVPSIVIVTFYFEKRRGLATGLAVTGSGLGTIAFPVLMEFLFSLYSWRGTMLITGAICLNIVVAGALFRPPPMGELQPETEDNSTRAQDPENIDPGTQRNSEDSLISHSSSENINNATSAQPCQVVTQSTVPAEAASESPRDNASTERTGLVSGQEVRCPVSVSCIDLVTETQCLPSNNSTESQTGNHSNKCCSKFWSELRMLLTSMLDKSLAKNWPYLVFCASNFILYLWVGVPYIYLIDRGLNLGIAGNLMFLPSIMGIGRTVGQIGLGYLGDQPKVNTMLLYAIAIAIAGAGTALVPLCQDFASLCVYSAVFGFFVSVTYAIQMLFVVELVGIDKATSAFGLLQLTQGIATLLGTPIAGWLYDAIGDYDASFYVSGVWIVVSSIMLLPLYWKKPNSTEPSQSRQ